VDVERGISPVRSSAWIGRSVSLLLALLAFAASGAEKGEENRTYMS
jgi:hypothetical protein